MADNNELLRFINKSLKGKPIIVAIQHEPYSHVFTPKGIQVESGAGGVHILLDGILQKTSGVMVAIATGSADMATADKNGRIKVPPDNPSYTLKRVFVKKETFDNFYDGFSNQTLWPLCHAVFIKPKFYELWWKAYIEVNRLFAKAILEEVGDTDSFIWINDYQLSLLPKLLKKKSQKIRVGTFWHIPWPTHEIFRICPWKQEILKGLLGSDFIGFHRGYHVENFIECTRRELEVTVDSEPRSITHQNQYTKLDYIPAGIDYKNIISRIPSIKKVGEIEIKKNLGIHVPYLAIGIDRVDYTKGLLERFKIIDRFLEKYPKFKNKFCYLGIGAPSRLHIDTYQQLNNEIIALIEKINKKYATATWKPILYINKVLPRKTILSYYYISDICLVTSLDDGMNLVAKEYIICNQPSKGMLVLSKFTGAAKDLTPAIQINPYDINSSADALSNALELSKEEKIDRNTKMKEIVKSRDIDNWEKEFISKSLDRF